MDNGVVIQSNENIIMQLVFNLKDFLEIEWQQGVETFLGVEVTQNDRGFCLSQTKLINKILDDYWEKASLTKSPAPSGYHALTENVPDRDTHTSTDYLSQVGSLSYLVVGTQPDLAYVVNYMAFSSSKPTRKLESTQTYCSLHCKHPHEIPLHQSIRV